MKIRTSNLLIRSQMLYPVELRVLRERLICGGRPGRQPQRDAFTNWLDHSGSDTEDENA